MSHMVTWGAARHTAIGDGMMTTMRTPAVGIVTCHGARAGAHVGPLGATPMSTLGVRNPCTVTAARTATAVTSQLAQLQNTHATKTTVASAFEVWFGNDVDKAA